MDQLSAQFYRYQKMREDMEKIIENADFLSVESKERWKGMLMLLTKNQLADLQEVLLRESARLAEQEPKKEKIFKGEDKIIYHPKDFGSVEDDSKTQKGDIQ